MNRIILLILICCIKLHSQSTLITPGNSGNVQLPNLSNAQIQAINNPNSGAILFDNTFQVLRFFDGNSWVCVGCSQNTIQSIKLMRVKSFTLTSSGSTFFSSNIRDFKASDNAVGDAIDATNMQTAANGYLLNKSEIVVFDTNIPPQIANLNLSDVAKLLSQINWTFSYKYQQGVDVSVNSEKKEQF
jgi:hypothetical protein